MHKNEPEKIAPSVPIIIVIANNCRNLANGKYGHGFIKFMDKSIGRFVDGFIQNKSFT